MIKVFRGLTFTLTLGGVLLAAGLTGVPSLSLGNGSRVGRATDGLGYARTISQQSLGRAPESNPGESQMEIPEKIRIKQERDLRKYRFKKLKDHAAELAKLSASLKEDLDKSNENILSLEIVDKAHKIEKLAKKIQDEAKSGR